MQPTTTTTTTPTPTPTPTLSLPQIQFLNRFLYSKPHSFRNPNTLFHALRTPTHFHNLFHLRQNVDLLYILANNKYI